MKPKVDHALSDIFLRYAAFFLDRANIQNTFVRHIAAGTCVEDGIVILESVGDVVGAENSHLSCQRQTFFTHQCDIGPRDRQNRRTSKGCGGDDIVVRI